jgi:hypothetical protein
MDARRHGAVAGPRRRRSASAARSAGLLALAYAFVSVATVVTHEAGHWLLDRAAGVPVRLVAAPFGAPHIEAVGPAAAIPLGWPDAAGPLANVLVGLLLFGLLWRARRPLLLPLLLWAPVALLQEGVNALVQLGTRAPGTDLVRLIQHGVPAAALWTAAAVAVAAGVAGLFAVRPLFRLPPSARAPARVLVLAAGFAAYPAIGLIAARWLPWASPERNVTLLVFAALLALVLGVPGTRAGAFPATGAGEAGTPRSAATAGGVVTDGALLGAAAAAALALAGTLLLR